MSCGRSILSVWMNGSHVGFVRCLGKGVCRARLSRYPNSDSTFQLTRLSISWDINLNPGPDTEKKSCFTCARTIACNHRSLACNLCGLRYHIKCGRVTPKRYKEILENVSMTWTCSLCPQHPKQGTSCDLNLFSLLPYASLSDESFRAEASTSTPAVLSSSLSGKDALDARKLLV